MKMQFIKALRLPEVLLMSGFLIIGSFFAISQWDVYVLYKLITVCFISFFTILSIYSYNSAAGKTGDKYNIRLTSLKRFSARWYLTLGTVFLVASLCLSVMICWLFIILNLLLFFTWVVYSHPVWGLKHTPYWGTVLHFFAQIIHFNMFYFAFKPLDLFSLTLSVYFANAFAAGHLNHEIIDYDSDRQAAISNTATRKGVGFVSVCILIICAINILYACGLLVFKMVDVIPFVLLIIPAVLHFVMYLVNFRRIKSYALKIRNHYRAFYLLSFLLLILYRIYESIT